MYLTAPTHPKSQGTSSRRRALSLFCMARLRRDTTYVIIASVTSKAASMRILRTHGVASAALGHALAAAGSLALGLSSGSGGALAECAHQTLDLSLHTATMQPILSAWWKRCVSAEVLAFGPVRLAALTRLAMTVCAIGAALFIGLDAALELLLPAANSSTHHHHGGAHHSQEHHHRTLQGDSTHAEGTSVAVPWPVAVASAACAIISWARAGQEASKFRQDRGDEKASLREEVVLERWVALRASLLLLCAGLGHTTLASSGAVEPSYVRHAPPLLRLLLLAFLRRPDASVAVVLAVLAVRRGCTHGSAPARLLLQTAPTGEAKGLSLIPDLQERLRRVRAVEGLIQLRDVRLWALDETRATGSVVAMVRMDADAQQVVARVRAALESDALTPLTVAIEREADEDLDEIGRSWAI